PLRRRRAEGGLPSLRIDGLVAAGRRRVGLRPVPPTAPAPESGLMRRRDTRAAHLHDLASLAARLTAQERRQLEAEAASGDVLARLALAKLAEPAAGPAAGAVEATAIPVTH